MAKKLTDSTWITEVGSSRLMPANRVEELHAVVDAAREEAIERVYWYSVEDVDWVAQREINLDWGPDPHDYATGLTPELEREIARLVRPQKENGPGFRGRLLGE